MHLIYGHATDKLSIRPNHQSALQNIHITNCAFLTPDIFYHWCDGERLVEVFNPDQQTKPELSYQPDIGEVTVRACFNRAKDEGWIDPGNFPMEPLGDREVLCLLSCDGIHSWSFNPNFTPNLSGMEPFAAAEECGMKRK